MSEKVRVNALVPKDLYDKIIPKYDTVTEAIIRGFEGLCEDNNSYEDLHTASIQQEERIADLKAQIQSLYEQLHTKDIQINTLTSNVDKNMQAQAVHIQTLIQETFKENILPTIERQNAQIEEIKKKKSIWEKFWGKGKE